MTTYECELCNMVKDSDEFYAVDPVAECELCAADGEAYWASLYYKTSVAPDADAYLVSRADWDDGYDVGDVKRADYLDRLLDKADNADRFDTV